MENQDLNVTKTQENTTTIEDPKTIGTNLEGMKPVTAEGDVPDVVDEGAKPDVEEQRISRIVSEVKAKEKALTAKERKLADREAKTKGYENIKQMLEDDPLQAIETLGISKEKLYEKIIKSGEKPTVEDEVVSLKEELKALKEEREKDKQELEQQKAERAISDFKKRINEYADKEKDASLKVTYALGQTSAIYDVIEQNFVATGEVMSIEDAGKRVEDFFRDKGRKEYEKLKAIFETEGAAEPVDEPTVDPEDKKTNPVVSKPKTLTNKSTVIPSADSGKLLSNEESKRLLAKKYANKLFS